MNLTIENFVNLLFVVIVALILGPGLIVFSFVLRSDDQEPWLLWIMFATGVGYTLISICYIIDKVIKCCCSSAKVNSDVQNEV